MLGLPAPDTSQAPGPASALPASVPGATLWARVRGAHPGGSERRCSLIRLLLGAGGKEGAGVSFPWPGAAPARGGSLDRGSRTAAFQPVWAKMGGDLPWLPIIVTGVSLPGSVSGLTGWVGHIGHPAGLGSAV